MAPPLASAARIHEDFGRKMRGASRGASTDEEDASWDDDWGGTNDWEAPAATADDDDFKRDKERYINTHAGPRTERTDNRGRGMSM